VPDIGGATDVVVIEVLVKVGDTVKVDTSLLTLESDKATMEVPSSDEGLVKEVKVKVGDKVSQGSIILVLECTSVEAAKTAVIEKPVNNAVTAPVPSPALASTPVEVVPVTNASVHAGPVVRKIAHELDIDLKKVAPTGPKQRILKEDILNYVKARLAQAASSGTGLPVAPTVDFAKFGSVEVQALSRIKKLSGKNLHRNWLLIPHITQFGEADITELEAFRLEQKEKHGIKLTPLVFIMKVVASALEAFPQFNASLDASGDNLILKKYFHIGVAVDTPEGLVVPVIRDVDKKGLIELAKELSIVSEKARNKQLTANDMQGGCFSISSLGGIGGTAFTPIVNMPEVAILGVSKSSIKPIYQEGQFVPRLMLPLSLSYDHRVIDGADGARFITYLSTRLSETWNLLL
jgi:pyruvate dehydrogenase E2 component (dihydrolipoamide acetyltransferase)